MTTKLKELKLSLKELKEKNDKLEVVHDDLITRHRVLKEEFTTLKVNNDNLELAYILTSMKHMLLLTMLLSLM